MLLLSKEKHKECVVQDAADFNSKEISKKGLSGMFVWFSVCKEHVFRSAPCLIVCLLFVNCFIVLEVLKSPSVFPFFFFLFWHTLH